MSDEMTIPCRVVLSGVPAEGFDEFKGFAAVEPGLQNGDHLEPAEDFGEGKLAFYFPLKVKKDSQTGRPSFLGPHAFGSPQERHVYICWCGDKDGERRPFRRMKVPLKTVEWRQVEGLFHAEDEVLQAEVSAQAEDGGPACATVALVGEGWHIVAA